MPHDLAGYKTILLFGGSFDPPHRAHISLPQQAAQAIGADVIAYIPAGRAPHKLDRHQTDAKHRLAMLRLALDEQPRAVPTVVLMDEINRSTSKPSYTVDTLQALRQQIAPDAKLRLLIGADQLRIFNTWCDHERVIALAEPLVMVRPPDTRESLLASLADEDRANWASRLVEVDQFNISSTEIRKAFDAGGQSDAHVCTSVANYIKQHNLYQ